MAQTPAVSNATKGIGSSLKNLPKPVLIGVPLAAAGAFYLWQKKKAASAAASTADTTSSSDTGTTADQGQGNWSSGGAFGGGYGNPNPLQQVLQNNPSTQNNPVTPVTPTVSPAVIPPTQTQVTSPASGTNTGATTLGGVIITPPNNTGTPTAGTLSPNNIGANATATSSYISPIVNSAAQEASFINQENQIIANEQAVTQALTPGSATYNPSGVTLQPGTTGVITVPSIIPYSSAAAKQAATTTTTSPTVTPAGTIGRGGKGALRAL